MNLFFLVFLPFLRSALSRNSSTSTEMREMFAKQILVSIASSSQHFPNKVNLSSPNSVYFSKKAFQFQRHFPLINKLLLYCPITDGASNKLLSFMDFWRVFSPAVFPHSCTCSLLATISDDLSSPRICFAQQKRVRARYKTNFYKVG